MPEFTNLRISRRGGGSSIGLEEWITIIGADRDFLISHAIEVRNPLTGKTIAIKRPFTAEWVKHPEERFFRFIYVNGEILIEAVTEPIDAVSYQKINELAAALEAELILM